MAIMSKSALQQNRIDNIYPNLGNEVGAAMVATFCDNFIDSIYAYTDFRWGQLSVWTGYKIGWDGHTYLDTQYNDLVFTNTDFEIRRDYNVNIKGTLETTIINQQMIVGEMYSQATIWTKDKNLQLIANLDEPLQMSITLADEEMYVVGAHIRGEYKSNDGTEGLTQTKIVKGVLSNEQFTYKNGLLVDITPVGYDVTLSVFNQTTTAVVEGATIDIYTAQIAPPTGEPLASYTTDVNGQVVFVARPNETYTLHIYRATYDDIYPELVINTDPKLVNYELPYTG